MARTNWTDLESSVNTLFARFTPIQAGTEQADPIYVGSETSSRDPARQVEFLSAIDRLIAEIDAPARPEVTTSSLDEALRTSDIAHRHTEE